MYETTSFFKLTIVYHYWGFYDNGVHLVRFINNYVHYFPLINLWCRSKLYG